MADKSIGDLTQATQLGDNDLFVLEQNGIAKKMLMALWKDYISRNVVSASASQLPAGSQPTAIFNPANGALSFGIPQGAKGDKGDKGNTGATGPQGQTGPQGPQGQTGPQGPQGQTGPQGPKGNDGADGRGFKVLSLYPTLLALQTAHPTGEAGDAYAVGTIDDNEIYIWDVDDEEWQNIGAMQGPQGPQGVAGQSAYNAAQSAGYTGTETQFNNDLATVGTKQAKITANGILKGDGTGGVSAAEAGTDYADASTVNALSAKVDGTDRLTVSSTFNFRKVAGGETIHDGMAKVKRIHGNTIAWNQLIKNGNFTDVNGWYGGAGAVLSASNGKLKITTGDVNSNPYAYRNDLNIPIGHKLLVHIGKLDFSGTTTQITRVNVYLWKIGFAEGMIVYDGARIDSLNAIVTTAGTASKSIITIQNYSANTIVGDYFEVSDVCLYDLTLMFGAGNEPTTAEEALALIGSGYNAYDAGSLRNFTGDIKSIGFNAWDEIPTFTNTHITTDYIPVLPGETYYVRFPSGVRWNLYEYDANKTQIKTDSNNVNRTYAVSANTNFVKLQSNVTTPYGTTYNNDICINISQPNTAISPHNGDYVPYTDSTLTIPKDFFDDEVMRSAGTVYDEITPTKAIKRVGTVDLGTLDWHWASDISRWVTTTFPSVFRIDTRNVVSQFGYRVFANVNYNLWAYFPQSESPHGYCNYELATPVETPLTLDLSYPVTPSGTEVCVSDVESSPCKAEIEYNMSIVDAVQELQRGARHADAIIEAAFPKMKVGVEYKTSEWYLGKPVYVKVVDFGVLPNATSKNVSIGVNDFDQFVDLRVSMRNKYMFNIYESGFSQVSIGETGNISIRTKIDMTAYSAYVIVKYTKTTD